MSLSVEAVKAHLSVLYGKFGISGLAQNEKRLRLAQLARQIGAIRPDELAG